ncbi:hypothetical protein [Methylobacterium sp. ARG-1]|uniref:hypothetical protein n=1 Tax=Methylobacterium sp. ARG-1 TaxID=1692501 RepID=UPI0006805F13|nr:hypothetical protein [Methylobacterium sp. ARG-1]KNY24546.1 hypothetical protein AKJ13_00855 [Methylobacterium sp. ARG-1]
MTPLTPIGWILFAAMWLAGPITGYTGTSLIASAWEHRKLETRGVLTFGFFATLLAISTLLLTFVAGL